MLDLILVTQHAIMSLTPMQIFFYAKVSNSMCYLKELLWDRYRMTHQIRYKLKWYGSLGRIQRTHCNDLACMKNVTC